MKIIAEKINGTREEIARAIRERDTAVIQDLAVAQTAAGATWLDVNAGTHPSREPDDLVWLVETVQSVEAMKTTVEALRAAGPPDLKIMIGGGQIDEEVREYTGADAWGKDAMTAVHQARLWYGVAEE